MTTPAADPQAEPTVAKRPYQPPALVEHGTVQTITQMADRLLDVGGGSGLSDPQG